MTKKISLPDTVDKTVRAMCEDYERRAGAIKEGALPTNLLANYLLLNSAIDDALAECCEESIREHMRRDIANGIGYRSTTLYFLTPRSYLSRKRKTKMAIAKALHLL